MEENFEEVQESMTNIESDKDEDEVEEEEEEANMDPSQFGCPFKRPRLDLAESVSAIDNGEVINQIDVHSEIVDDNEDGLPADDDYDGN